MAEPLAHRVVERLDVSLRQLLQRRLLLLPRDPIRGIRQVLEARRAGQAPPPAARIHGAVHASRQRACPAPEGGTVPTAYGKMQLLCFRRILARSFYRADLEQRPWSEGAGLKLYRDRVRPSQLSIPL